MEERIKKLEEEKEGKKKEGEEREIDRMEERMKDMKKKLEWRERDERKRNIIIKGLKIDKGNTKLGVEKVMREIGTEKENKRIENRKV